MSTIGRPHHHACLFGIDFPDKVIWQRKKAYNIYISDELSRVWSTRIEKPTGDKNEWKAKDGKYYRRKGFCTIIDCNFGSARYLARYVTKKVSGHEADDHYRVLDRETGEISKAMPEYVSCSNRPGIGFNWYSTHGFTDCHRHDCVHINGRVYSPPRYYDRLYERSDPASYERIKLERKKKALDNKEELTMVKQKQRRKIAERRLLRAGERSYEHGV